MALRTIANGLLGFMSGGAGVLGAFLTAYESLECYYLVTGRVVPGPEQPPLIVAGTFLGIGILLMAGGIIGHRIRGTESRKEPPDLSEIDWSEVDLSKIDWRDGGSKHPPG